MPLNSATARRRVLLIPIPAWQVFAIAGGRFLYGVCRSGSL